MPEASCVCEKRCQFCQADHDEEDRRRLLRERRRLVKERTFLTNAIKGLLKLQGVLELNPRAKELAEGLAETRTRFGVPFPPRARREVMRTWERLNLVERHIGQIEAERNLNVRQGAVLRTQQMPESGDVQSAKMLVARNRQKVGLRQTRNRCDKRSDLGPHNADPNSLERNNVA